MRLVPAFLLLFICTQLFGQFEEEVNPVASEFIVTLKPGTQHHFAVAG